MGGDKINLRVELEDLTRLVIVTQGSTKLFKSPSRSIVSGQTLDVKIGSGAALCYLPDPTQPFTESVYEQRQTFYVEPNGSSSLLMLDWVSEGRRARGESWTLWGWKGRNEVRAFDPRSKGRLLLRDAVMLTDDNLGGVGLLDKTSELGVFGTLIIYGPHFKTLGEFFVAQFAKQPRIGAKNWSVEDQPKSTAAQLDETAVNLQQAIEQRDGLLWTAASIRGFVLVKFGAKDIDGARRWLGRMLRSEGSVERHFGHQSLICLR